MEIWRFGVLLLPSQHRSCTGRFKRPCIVKLAWVPELIATVNWMLPLGHSRTLLMITSCSVTAAQRTTAIAREYSEFQSLYIDLQLYCKVRGYCIWDASAGR